MCMVKWPELLLIIGAKYINFGATVLSNFQCRGVQRIWRALGQGPTGLAEGVGGNCFFSLFHSFSLSLGNGSKFIEKLAQEPSNPSQQPTNYMNVTYILLF